MANRRGPIERRGPKACLIYLYWACLCVAASWPVSALEWEQGDGYRRASLPVVGKPEAGFTSVSPDQTGVFFTNRISDSLLNKNQIFEVGSGVALGDVDGDGRVDIYACGMENENRLYRNLGDWRFEDVTAKAGVACANNRSTGAVLADVDGDRDLDLLVNGIGSGTRLFLNDGRARFTEVMDSGLDRETGSTSMALGDIDGDGDPDLYVANYHVRTVKDSMSDLDVSIGYKNGEMVISPPGRFVPMKHRSGKMSLFELGQADALYRNEGNGRFDPVRWDDGAFKESDGEPLKAAPQGWGLAAMFRDMNRDGAPDLYVCNDFFHSPDHIWINRGDGTFEALSPLSIRHTSMSSMAVDFADINRDGNDDFFVADMMSRSHERRHRQRGSLIHIQVGQAIEDPRSRPEFPRNMLFVNRGDGTYAEIAPFSGVEATEWTWAVAFLDVDLDGYEDLLITNGTLRDANDADRAPLAGNADDEAKNARFPQLKTSNLAFRNRRNNAFEEMGSAWGFNKTGISHGMAFADLDRDGDQDVVVNHANDFLGLYRNNASGPRIAVRLKGAPPNTRGIGARVTVRSGAVKSQSQEIISGGRYLSGDDTMRTFAVGDGSAGRSIEVLWRSGRRSRVDSVEANNLYEIVEPTGSSSRDVSAQIQVEKKEEPSVWFEDVGDRLPHPHQDPSFDDFSRQPLLSWKLSSLGPGLSWFDVDRDGWEDLLRSSGRKGNQVVYLNKEGKGFRPMRRQSKMDRAQSTLLVQSNPDDQASLLSAFSHYVDAKEVGPALTQFNLQSGQRRVLFESGDSSPGPLALGVLDGSQVLFVGGRVRPARYPEPASSHLYVRNEGSWELDQANGELFKEVGLVSDATWSDLNGDGRLELLVACEWGPIRVFTSDAASVPLREITGEIGLHRYKGWWNGIATGDFNGDGRLDILATNKGENTKYHRYARQPIRLYYGDWDGNGVTDMLECYFDSAMGTYVPYQTLDRLRQFIPQLAAQYSTFEEYAHATVDGILGDHLENTRRLEVNWHQTTLFLNHDGRLEPRVLPPQAQWAPAFGAAVADYNGDGKEDVFLSQNFFGVTPETSRHDAGRGLLLAGDSQGGFRTIDGEESGIVLYGEQRAAAVCDFDHDGRPDLAVAQHNGPTGLFRNRTGDPGLRVTLSGPQWNTDGFGAVMALEYGEERGPCRIVTAGSGYWSQSAPVQILGLAGEPTAIHVRWPDGKEQSRQLQPGQMEVNVSYEAPID